jgi:GLPGLI family protein
MLNKLSISLFFTLFLVAVNAQKTEYLVEYKGINTEKTEEENFSLTMAFSHGKSHIKMKIDEIETIVIADEKERKSIILLHMMGLKLATSLEGNDFGKLDFMKDFISDFRLEETKERKKILGYNCKLIIAHPKEGDESFQIWYTEDLTASGSFDLAAMGSKIKGLPLLMTWKKKDGSSIKWQAVRINTSKQEKALFNLELPYGYSLISSDLFLKD